MRASSTSRMPLRISLPGQMPAIHSTSFQLMRRVELLGDPARQILYVLHAADMAGKIAERLALAAHHAQCPGRLGGDVDQVADTDFRRHAQAVFDVAVALAEDLQIDGDYQRAALGRRRPLDQRTDEAAILHDVELKPERLVDRAGDVFDRTDRHGRQRERNSCSLGRAARQNLAVAALHAAHPDRRQSERQRHRFTEYRRLHTARRHVDEDALTQLDRLEIGAVRVQRLFGIGAATRHIRRTSAAPGGARSAAGPRCKSWFSWRGPGPRAR